MIQVSIDTYDIMKVIDVSVIQVSIQWLMLVKKLTCEGVIQVSIRRCKIAYSIRTI